MNLKIHRKPKPVPRPSDDGFGERIEDAVVPDLPDAPVLPRRVHGEHYCIGCGSRSAGTRCPCGEYLTAQYFADRAADAGRCRNSDWLKSHQ